MSALVTSGLSCLNTFNAILDLRESIRTMHGSNHYTHTHQVMVIAYVINELFIGIGKIFLEFFKLLYAPLISEVKEVYTSLALPLRVVSVPLGIHVGVAEQNQRLGVLAIIRYIPLMRRVCSTVFPILLAPEVILVTALVEASLRLIVCLKF